MSRSIKKGPFVDAHLAKKVEAAAEIRDRRELLSKYDFPGDDIPIVMGSALKALEGITFKNTLLFYFVGVVLKICLVYAIILFVEHWIQLESQIGQLVDLDTEQRSLRHRL